jgi:capsular exopolysaccharide synthesis family protein
MLQLNEPLVGVGDAKSRRFETNSPTEMLKSFTDFLRRQFPIILSFILLCIAIGVAYLLTAPQMFTAHTSMIIDTHKVQLFRNLEQSSNNNIVDTGMVDSEVELLKSENVSLAVIKRFNLANDPEFIGPGSGIFQTLLGWVSDLSGHRFGQGTVATEYERTRRAAAIFANRLTVKRVGLSYIIEVSFESLDPKRAADIADAVANEYIVDQLQAKFQAARQAGGWLRDRLRELREQASTAERAVVEFKVQNNIVSIGGSDKRHMHEQQVAELNSQLAIARAQVSEASARLERIQSVLRAPSPDATVDETVADSLKNEVVNKLRSQYLTLAEREDDWSRRYGSNHLAVINIRNQMSEIRHSILDELRRIAESYKSDYAIAKERQAGIEQELAQAVVRSQSASRAQVQLTELESNAQSYRTLHDDFLQRYTESVQAQSFPVTDARIVTPAARPLSNSHPKTFLVLLISAFGGTVLGLLAGHLRDLSDRVFRTREQVERLLALDCLATVPKIKVGKTKGDLSRALSTNVRKTKGSATPVATIKVSDEPHGGLPPAPTIKVSDEPHGGLPPAPTIKVSNEPHDGLPPAPTIKVSDEPHSGLPPAPNVETDDESNGEASPSPNDKVGEPNSGSSHTAEEMVGESFGPRTIARRDQLVWQVVDFPLSPYAEAIRSIKMAVDLTKARISKKVRKPKKVLGITSSSPGEGKSTTAASLAQLISHSGKRVILVDCDLRAPRLTRVLAPDAKAGLLEVLSGDAALHDVIWTDQSKKLSFLPAVATARIPHTAEIIGAEEMHVLFDRLRGAYDYVIVDLTPLVPIIDVRASEALVDYYVFVIEWGRTKIDLVQRSLKEAPGIYNKIIGAVLNKVDNTDLKRYEGYGGYDHDQYYRR